MPTVSMPLGFLVADRNSRDDLDEHLSTLASVTADIESVPPEAATEALRLRYSDVAHEVDPRNWRLITRKRVNDALYSEFNDRLSGRTITAHTSNIPIAEVPSIVVRDLIDEMVRRGQRDIALAPRRADPKRIRGTNLQCAEELGEALRAAAADRFLYIGGVLHERRQAPAIAVEHSLYPPSQRGSQGHSIIRFADRREDNGKAFNFSITRLAAAQEFVEAFGPEKNGRRFIDQDVHGINIEHAEGHEFAVDEPGRNAAAGLRLLMGAMKETVLGMSSDKMSQYVALHRIQTEIADGDRTAPQRLIEALTDLKERRFLVNDITDLRCRFLNKVVDITIDGLTRSEFPSLAPNSERAP